jgi:DNA (cytosine-5)-methyltransferase 1
MPIEELMVSKTVTYVDLFCGAGGLSQGFHLSGWSCLLASDWWKDAIDSFRTNHSGVPLLAGDVRDLDARRLTSLLDDRPDWIVGGPPCQGFSTVGKRTASDPRNGLVREFHRIVKHVRPGGFLIENVLGLKDMRFVRGIKELFEDVGYRVVVHVLTAADYGVPQLRRRVIFVGHRDRGWFTGVPRTHAPERYVTLWDAIGDLPAILPGQTIDKYDQPPKSAYQRAMRKGSTRLQGHTVSAHPPELVKAISFIPDGGNRRSIPDEYQPRSGYHNSYSRLSSNAPAVAVTQNMGKPSGTRCIHPFQHRGLTTREGARLQSFPDVYEFQGGVTSQRLQVANAVPPLVARAISRALASESAWSDSPPAGVIEESNRAAVVLPDPAAVEAAW